MPRLTHLRTLFTTTLKVSKKSTSNPHTVKPALPLHLAITEPVTCSVDTTTTPISPTLSQFPVQFPNAQDLLSQSSRPATQTRERERPRSIVINISNLSAAPDSCATDVQYTKLLARTQSRRFTGRKVSMSKIHINAPRQTWRGAQEVRRPQVPSKPRPNSYFGMGFEMEIEELERIVDEVEGLSRRCREGEARSVGEWEGEVQGEMVGYVQL